MLSGQIAFIFPWHLINVPFSEHSQWYIYYVSWWGTNVPHKHPVKNDSTHISQIRIVIYIQDEGAIPLRKQLQYRATHPDGRQLQMLQAPCGRKSLRWSIRLIWIRLLLLTRLWPGCHPHIWIESFVAGWWKENRIKPAYSGRFVNSCF